MKKIYANTQFIGDISLGIRGEISTSGSIDNQNTEDVSILYFSGSSPSLTGLINSDITAEKILFLYFSGTGTMILTSQSVSSSANNRFLFDTSTIVLSPNQGIVLIYDTAMLRWRVYRGSGGGASTFTSLIDAFPSYVGQSGKKIKVNSAETGLTASYDEQNVISNPTADASNSISALTVYNDTAGVAPVDGLSGSPVITVTRNTTAPMSGIASYRMTKGATNRQGDGFSFPFTLTRDMLGKTNEITFNFETISGTLAIGDLRVYIIQDPAGAPFVIEPINVQLSTAVVGNVLKHIATFQSHISITSYRLCIHVASTSALAYTVDFNNFKIWEPTQNYGPVITNPVEYTPTFVGMTPTGVRFTWEQNGKNIRIKGRGIVASNTSTQWSFTTPNGVVPDLGYSSGDGVEVGFVIRGASSDGNLLSLLGRNDNLIRFGGYVALAGNNPLSWNTWNPFSGGEAFNIDIEFPVLGWGSNMVLSSQSGDGREIKAAYLFPIGTSSTTGGTDGVKPTTKLEDTHNILNTATGAITIPAVGRYRFCLNHINNSSSHNYYLWRSRNGGALSRVAYMGVITTTGGATCVEYDCLIGDIMYVSSNVGVASTLNSTDGFQILTITKVESSNQIIIPTANISLSLLLSSGWSVSTGAYLSLAQAPSVEWDTHGMYDQATGVFSVPFSGKYKVHFNGRGAATSNMKFRTALFPSNTVLKEAYIDAGNPDWNWGGSAEIQLRLLSDVKYRLWFGGDNTNGTTNIAGGAYIYITRIGDY